MSMDDEDFDGLHRPYYGEASQVPAPKTVAAPSGRAAGDGSLDPLVRVLTRIADALEAVVDVEKRTLRMVDVERGNVYKTHLGGKLSGEKAP